METIDAAKMIVELHAIAERYGCATEEHAEAVALACAALLNKKTDSGTVQTISVPR